jgi:hypothetical protein
MGSMVEERLEAWFKKNNPSTNKGTISLPNKGTVRLPTSILFYRDGISESQFAHCNDGKNGEIPAIRKAFARFATKHDRQNAPLKLTFVVVGKRHHTRFYPTSPTHKDGNRTGNIQPGLLVDQVVTAPMPERNFFLQSHSAIKGTARSAHYHVLEDGIGFPGETLENLTHHLCYSFQRATKGVSYVAPAYIADRLCERGRAYLREWQATDADKNPPEKKDKSPPTENEMKVWRRARAQALSQNRTWWPNYNETPANGQPRLNPWHSNLDDVMFWM